MILESFRTNQRLYANTDGHSYTCVVFRELNSEDSVQKLYRIIFRNLSRSTTNYVHGITFRELHSQKHPKNYVNIHRIMIR